MVIYITSVILKLMSLGCVIGASGVWAGASVNTRPKNRDEQTLVGGAIWSQTVIPVGLVISMLAEDQLAPMIHGYFLITGSMLLLITGLIESIGECLKYKKRRQSTVLNVEALHTSRHTFDKFYLTIGILCVVAGILTFADFIITVM